MAKHIPTALLNNILTRLETLDADTSVIKEYSGRLMYGHHCLAFQGNNPSTALAAIVLALNETTDHNLTIEDFVGDQRQEELGMGLVLYFPNVTCGAAHDTEFYKPTRNYLGGFDFFQFLQEQEDPYKRWVLKQLDPSTSEVFDELPQSWIDKLVD